MCGTLVDINGKVSSSDTWPGPFTDGVINEVESVRVLLVDRLSPYWSRDEPQCRLIDRLSQTFAFPERIVIIVLLCHGEMGGLI